MRTAFLGIAVLLIGLVGWLTVPSFVVSSLHVPVVQGQPSASELPSWLAPLVVTFELLVVIGVILLLVAFVKRFKRKASQTSP